MKKRILFSALLLGASSMMLTGFDSAATPEDVMAKCTEASKDATDFSANLDMNLAIGIDMTKDGDTQNMDVSILGDLAMDFIEDPLSAKISGTLSATLPGQETVGGELQVYLVPGDEGAWDCFAGFTDEGEVDWEYTKLPAEQMSLITEALNSAEADTTQVAGTLSLAPEAVDVNGISCYELTNTITYADIADVLTEALVASGQLGNEEDVQSTMAMVSMAVSGLKLNSILYIDTATYLPAKARIDMNGSDLTALCQMLSYILAETNAEGNAIFPELTMDISDLYYEIIYDYNAPESIQVPEEGLREKADSDGDDNLTDLAKDMVDEIA